jgi:phage FluMu protein Com
LLGLIVLLSSGTFSLIAAEMAFFFSRINCHFCGARSAHAKGSGIPEFQCASCEAINFLDSKGNILDTPYTAAAPTPQKTKQKLFGSFTRDPASDPARGHQAQQVFCNACLHNQQVYNESLANYLPDEDHPQYAEYEEALPRWKKALEERYPQICVACAPKAQLKINRADYYSVTDNLNKTHIKASRRRGASPAPAVDSRDDWYKASMRAALGLLGLITWASLAAQILWHAYGIWDTMFGRVAVRDGMDDLGFETNLRTCFAAATRLHSEKSCHRLFGAYMPKILLANLCLVWYNHGLRAYYNPLVRYDHITGQKQHFLLQAIVMAIRTASYVVLSDESRLRVLKWSQIVAIHAATIAVMLIGRGLARGAIEIHKWRLTNKMMPKPEDQDVLSQYAGPATERHVPQASSKLPFDIHAKKHREPFTIQALAPQRSTYGSNVWNRSAGGPPPSPQGSDSTVEDPMDWDAIPPVESRMPGVPDTRTYNPYAATASGRQVRPTTVSQRFGAPSPKGWEDMRSNLFSIEDDLRDKSERQKFQAAQNAHKLSYNPRADPSPFRGRLPQAPMSMERRLRNPISQVPQFKEPPVTQQKNFLDQMREGIDKGKPFARDAATRLRPRTPADDDASDIVSTTEFSPAAARTRGNLDLRPSDWHLPADAAAATGLEDLFGGNSFRISESPELMPRGSERRPARRAVPAGTLWTMGATVVLVALGLFVFHVPAVKRWVFLGLYDLLVRAGV